ncbi:ribonuclease J [Candidatus Peregrinibacteria bacterium]|mgnify:CR=1 FL=1|jgi:ribonuclease J|nr:ribonuclease J [Candidatus Peregrinibacteria bacterium]MBT3598228.1 ribonuclease J [Candidatus Peregrinibacteria bacterium]MBT4367146.1 ribonuclease J [Candidatus Peregrinibacteria bacterium]MBT7009874.1 ribonuclease J [Candidatus Peregrinibacteria bacterium]MBT7345014.1 ribonuclease J [Candidatus Peregrinibacteria bacterium]
MKNVGEWIKKEAGQPAQSGNPKPINSSPHKPKRQHRGPKNKPQTSQQPVRKNGLRIYPLGGFEQVGRNLTVIEVDGEIYIIDLGLQFPDEEMLGIDYLIPDISSLKGKENRIKGVLFTHGHLDHIGAAPHLMKQLHFPPCYGTKLTMALLRKRLDEEHLTAQSHLYNATYGEKIKLGKVEVEFLRVTHSIPDSAAIAVHTPYGTILHTGDFKFDLTPTTGEPADFQRLAELGKKGVLAIIADSTNATKSGNSTSEKEISDTLFQLIRDSEGRVIVSTFSSLLNRVEQVIEHAKKFNRKVFVSGRSMQTNIEIAQEIGYLKTPRGLIRQAGPGINKLPDNQVLIITTGSQGEENAGLARIGLGTHRQISVKKGDTVILSSNPIIGNERSVAKVINNLSMKGATVKTNAELSLHTTGHGHRGDLLLMHQLVRARHVIPEHGEPHMRAAHEQIAKDLGYQENQIHQLSNGEILEFDASGNARKSKQKLTVNDIIIDGKGATGEGQRVINDRKIMSSGGVVTVVFRCYAKSKRLVGDPDVISRGLMYGSEQHDVTKDVAKTAKKAYEDAINTGENDRKAIKRSINGALFRYFNKKLNREPMIIPIIIEV